MEQSISDRKKQANIYRKKENYDLAVPLYESLWAESRDAFDGAGLLSCYRKKGDFKNAIPLAEKLSQEHSDFEWAVREISWTLIQGKIQQFDEKTPLVEVVNTANRILDYEVDFLAKKLTVFRVLKLAKGGDNWEIITEWVNKIDVDSLSATPIKFQSGKEGWSDRCLWYNYKVNALLKNGDFATAKEYSTKASGECFKQKMFFERLHAQALKGLGEIQTAVCLYDKLCSNKRSDWWLLHEYGNLLRVTGDIEKALSTLCKAALSNRNLDMMVKLFSDIASLFSLKQNDQKAYVHLYLEKYIREKQDWPISNSLNTAINKLDGDFTEISAPADLKEALSECKKIWNEVCGASTPKDKSIKNMIGRFSTSKNESFGFINAKNGISAICFTRDLPENINNGDEVIFDAIPSFDKKKNKESWKVVKITKE